MTKTTKIKTDYYHPEYEVAPEPGTIGFVVEKVHNTAGWARYEIRDIAPKTNQSFESRVHGWCGTYNDLATFGAGIGRISRVFQNGRVEIEVLTKPSKEHDFELVDLSFGEVIAEYLDNTGYEFSYI